MTDENGAGKLASENLYSDDEESTLNQDSEFEKQKVAYSFSQNAIIQP